MRRKLLFFQSQLEGFKHWWFFCGQFRTILVLAKVSRKGERHIFGGIVWKLDPFCQLRRLPTFNWHQFLSSPEPMFAQRCNCELMFELRRHINYGLKTSSPSACTSPLITFTKHLGHLSDSALFWFSCSVQGITALFVACVTPSKIMILIRQQKLFRQTLEPISANVWIWQPSFCVTRILKGHSQLRQL